ncbi:MAG: hypothetical protein ACRCZF_19535, partial [Gemmataceae bacterium]
MKRHLRAVVVLFMSAVVGGPLFGQATPDYYPMNSRTVKLGIIYEATKKAKIRQTELFVSRNQGQTWEYESSVKPDTDSFMFVAKDDGLHWFQMVTLFTDGTRDPIDVTKNGDIQKLLVDSTAPVVRLSTAQKQGEEIQVEWAIEERFLNDSKTVVSYRPAIGTEADWKEVPHAKNRARFNPQSNAALIVRVTVEDLVGNTNTASREVGSPAGGATTSPTPAAGTSAEPARTPTLSAPELLVPAITAPVVALTADMKVTPAPSPSAVAAPAGTPPAPTPVPTTPTAPPALASGSGAGTTPVSVAPMAVSPPSQPELPVAQLVNYTNLELPVSLEAGPSGVKNMDLYVTRDDGRSWQRLSQHDGRDTNLKVNLRPRNETNVDGVYGFRIVATSGAGLSDELPRSGTVPEMRVQVDMTPPVITIYEPTTEPNQKDLLMLNWQVTDKNMGKAPVALEWSEGPSGPWKPCAGNSSVQQVAV